MYKRLMAAVMALALVFSVVPTMTVSAANDYPEPWRSGYRDQYQDSWGMYSRECTSWVAWCLSSRNGYDIVHNYNGWKDWNANVWNERAYELGVAVDSNPAVGAVAWWGPGYHVAYVEAVNGDSVYISEYNSPAGSGNYNERWINRYAPSGYIHFKDIGGGAGGNIGDDYYALISSPHYTGMYLTNDGVNVSLRKYRATKNQIWHVSRASDGSYRFTSYADGKCLEIADTTSRSNIQVYEDNGTAAQRWFIEGGENNYVFKSKQCNYVIDIDGLGTEGNRMQIYAQNNSYSQKFAVEKVSPSTVGVNIGDDYYAVISSPHYAGMYLTNDGVNVSLRKYRATKNQIWHVSRASDGSYRFTSYVDGKCLEIAGVSSRSNIQVYEDNGTAAQRWFMEGSVGNYTLRSKQSLHVIDIDGFGKEGDRVQIYEPNNTYSQRFAVEKVSPSAVGVDIGDDYYALISSPHYTGMYLTNDGMKTRLMD